MRCWTSLQVRQGRTCNIRATIPAASGAAADVPVWASVHPVPVCTDQSDVTCRVRGVACGENRNGVKVADVLAGGQAERTRAKKNI